MRQNFTRIIFVLGVTVPMTSLLADITNWRQDSRMLPQYCQDRAKEEQPSLFKRWAQIFGDVSIHIHHYCDGIKAELDARTALDKSERNQLLRGVAGQMEYVSSACTSGCVLYPELHTRWGWALGELGDVAGAVRQYQLALRGNPKYVPAYLRWSDLYVELKEPDEARKIIEQGLKANPKSRALQHHLKKLGPSE